MKTILSKSKDEEDHLLKEDITKKGKYLPKPRILEPNVPTLSQLSTPNPTKNAISIGHITDLKMTEGDDNIGRDEPDIPMMKAYSNTSFHFTLTRETDTLSNSTIKGNGDSGLPPNAHNPNQLTFYTSPLALDHQPISWLEMGLVELIVLLH